MDTHHPKGRQYLRHLLLAILPLLFFAQSAQAVDRVAKGKLDGISIDPTTQLTQISGWACKVNVQPDHPPPADQKMDIHVYAVDENAPPGTFGDLIGFYGEDTNGQLVNGPAWNASETEAALCGLSGLQQPIRFVIRFPASVEAAHAGKRIRAYALCRAGSTGCTSQQIYMDDTKPDDTPYFAYRFSAANSTGWSSLTNYFTTWGCRAPPGGINTIRRLNIAPIGTHTKNTWKDSLHVDFSDFVGGNPTIYFTGTSFFSTPLFRLQRAQFNDTTGNWSVTDFHSNYSNTGGISSQDGRGADYVTNVYHQKGWGPSANRPGNVSNIPGVSTTATGGEYPLIGSGTYGISTIRELEDSSNLRDPNTKSCLHMNPSLFDYSVNGSPRGLMACLWTGNGVDTASNKGCALPPGTNGTATDSAHYVYRHNASTGWQLDPEPLSMLGNCHETGTVNYVHGSNEQFYATKWKGRIDLLDLPSRSVTQGVLDCTSPGGDVVHFAEASGSATDIYFIATEPAQFGPANGLNPGIPTHDIYVGFHQ